jgi:hypothetical protein
MPYREALRLAIATIRGAKLRAFFTLLGIIVSVAFLVTVVAVIATAMRPVVAGLYQVF